MTEPHILSSDSSTPLVHVYDSGAILYSLCATVLHRLAAQQPDSIQAHLIYQVSYMAIYHEAVTHIDLPVAQETDYVH